MKKNFIIFVMLTLLFATFCTTPSLKERHTDALTVMNELRAGNFDKAANEADKILQKDKDNPYALLVRAISRYTNTMQQLMIDVRTTFSDISKSQEFNHRFMRYVLARTDKELELVEMDLAKAANYKDVYLELSPAFWKFDWNQDGQFDNKDSRILEVEVDENGNEIPEGDPRRRPMFRFDHGDVLWAQAFVNFQRVPFNILLAYEWGDLDTIFKNSFRENSVFVIKLTKPELMAKARSCILNGLDLADQARKAYLAETDDDREWLPNPNQKSHPIPLPVTEELYKTWADVLGDLKSIILEKEGLSLSDTAKLLNIHITPLPKGVLNIGKMLSHPKDIVLDIKELDQINSKDIEGLMKTIYGEYYEYELKPSPLTQRLTRMKNEVNLGQETLERKLRYLIWLN